MALELVERAVQNELPFRAVIADSADGDNLGFVEGLERLEVGFVLALKPSHSWWHPAGQVGSGAEAVRIFPWSPVVPGAWQKIVRRCRDGHQETWWAMAAAAGPYGPEKTQRREVVSTDPENLPELTTGYLLTNLPLSGSVQAAQRPRPTADLADGAPPAPRLAGALDYAAALLAGVVSQAPASPIAGPA